MILDEAHSIGAFPKPSKRTKLLKELFFNTKIVYFQELQQVNLIHNGIINFGFLKIVRLKNIQIFINGLKIMLFLN
jgi:hypothetical protein